MEILHDPHIDFMKYRRFWVAVSFVTIVAGLIGIFFFERLNFGVDFAGGTQLVLKFRSAPDVEQLRKLVEGAGFREAQIQRFGERGANEVLVRTPIVGGSEEGSAAQVKAALDAQFNPGATGLDLNQIGGPTLADVLSEADPDAVGTEAAGAHYQATAEAVLKLRKDRGIFDSFDQVASAAGLSPRALDVLRQRTHVGNYSVLSIENVGPQVGRELRKRGFLAVIGAILGMLVYIALRFEMRFGVGATMATLHDVLITLGVFAWAGFEFNLTTIAAFLTLIGYSVNDTVVTFDRVRENMRKSRTLDTLTLLNRAINQTLSRTILTGGTVLLASGALLLLGGDVIRGFAFVMFVGVIVGTYSSIYIASPFALYWEHWFGSGGRLRGTSAAAASAKPTSPRNAPTKPAPRPGAARSGGGRAR
jgi:preprotein translocase subunit SecF